MIVSALLLTFLSIPLGPLPPLGKLLEPRGGFWTAAEDVFPADHQVLTFPGLANPVEVFRDAYGVPHIFAEDDMDLYKAVGYIQASDRLFQMDVQRRASEGKLAEVFGQSFVETDKFLRTIGLSWAVERSYQDADADTLAVLQAFADGVNTYIGDVSPLDLPLEFKLLDYRPADWHPTDTIALGKFLGWSLSGTFEDLELQLFTDAYGQEATALLFPVDGPFPLPVVPPGSAGVSPSPTVGDTASPEPIPGKLVKRLLTRYAGARPILGQAESFGSNNWVVSGSRSSTGSPILANDPHLGLTVPAIWYMMRLVSPSYNVYGVAAPGMPLPVLGYNEHIAWGFTNVGADVVDFFIEEVNPDNDLQYLHQGQWMDFTVREEVINVRGGNPVTLLLRVSGHGPVISDLEMASGFTDTIAMQWTGHLPTPELRAILSLCKATNWNEFRAALENFQVPAQNVIYADTEGNIGIVVNGLYPIRNQGLGRVPVDGASGDYDWAGFVPFDEIPAALNPDQGFLASANQLPAVDSAHYMGWSWADRYRAARINEVLNSTNPISIDEVKALQLDHVSVAAREFTPYVLQAFDALGDDGASLHPKAPDAIAQLRLWNYDMAIDKVAPTLYTHWLVNYRTATFGDEWNAADLGGVGFPTITILENMTKFDPASQWFDDVGTTPREERDDIIRRAFVEALDELAANFTTDVNSWRWGEVHLLQLIHPTGLEQLSSPAVSRPGGWFTVDVAGAYLSGGEFLVTGGPSWRLVVDFSTSVGGGMPDGYGIYPGGQSGRTLSPHYLDLFELWRNGEYLDLELTEKPDFQAISSSREG